MKEILIVFVLLAFASVGLLNRSSAKIYKAEEVDSLIEKKICEHELIIDTVKSNIQKIEQLNNFIK